MTRACYMLLCCIIKYIKLVMKACALCVHLLQVWYVVVKNENICRHLHTHIIRRSTVCDDTQEKVRRLFPKILLQMFCIFRVWKVKTNIWDLLESIILTTLVGLFNQIGDLTFKSTHQCYCEKIPWEHTVIQFINKWPA